MTVPDRVRAANLNHSPKARNVSMPDPTWKAQQAFIRATRRGSKKRTSMEQKLELLDAAQKAIPTPVNHVAKEREVTAARHAASALLKRG